ncbi:MAG: Trk system potassium transporter TrkA [Candidatus Cryptobacteroides sp.]|nr:Trk system potassium transporter TrkA [Bacteroidales bacterium]
MTIIIEGAGEVGSHLAKMLSEEANDITVIDCDAERLSRLSLTADVVTITGSLSSIKVLKEAGVESADLFIAVNPAASQDVNLVSALLAKKLGCKKVCARINDEEYLSYENKFLFTEMGIDLMFYPEKIAAAEITGLLKHKASTESMDFARGKLQLAVFKLEDDSPVIDMKVSEFAAAMAPKLQFRVVAITRDNKTLMPQFDTRLKYHDVVFIITTRDGITPMMDFLGKSNIEVKNVMILGASQIGEMVAGGISKFVESVKVLDMDRRRCLELSENTDDNVLVVNGDGRDSDFLLEENIRDYDAFVAVTDNDEANILACVVAKKFGVGRTVAEVENIEYIRLAEEMGVDAVINKKLITAGKIFKMTLSNKVRFIKYMSGTDAEILEYIVAPESAITHNALKDTDFPRDAIIGGIIRGNESFIAVGDTKIEAYDRVVVFSLPNAVKEVDRLFK